MRSLIVNKAVNILDTALTFSMHYNIDLPNTSQPHVFLGFQRSAILSAKYASGQYRIYDGGL